jgi:biotin transport system substrate-specific component
LVRAMRSTTSRFRGALIAATVATVPIFLFGAAWFANYAHQNVSSTWSLAIAPFLPGELVKIPAAAGIFSSLQRWRQS